MEVMYVFYELFCVKELLAFSVFNKYSMNCYEPFCCMIT